MFATVARSVGIIVRRAAATQATSIGEARCALLGAVVVWATSDMAYRGNQGVTNDGGWLANGVLDAIRFWCARAQAVAMPRGQQVSCLPGDCREGLTNPYRPDNSSGDPRHHVNDRAGVHDSP